jgi:hypothetical protein
VEENLSRRSGQKNVFKRSADALLIDIGINDVGFASWAAGIILQDSFLRSAASAMTPCFDGTARCAATRNLFTRLDNRYGLLRRVLDPWWGGPNAGLPTWNELQKQSLRSAHCSQSYRLVCLLTTRFLSLPIRSTYNSTTSPL